MEPPVPPVQPVQPEQQCEQCEQPEQIPEQIPQNSNSQESVFMNILTAIVSILSIIRPSNLHSTFLLLANFDLYNYHKTNYSLFFGQVLQKIRNFEKFMWNIFPITTLSNWMQSPVFQSHYQTFSNQKIVEFNGNDGLFVQNTKPYFLLWLPISLLVFLVFNKLYCFCKKNNFKKGKTILIGYSLWANFVIMVTIQNSYSIVFYSLQNFSLLFFFTSPIKVVHIVSMIFFGLFFLIMIQVFPLVPYFQEDKKVKLLVDNPRFISPSITFGFLKFFWKIVLECGIHYYLYDSPGKQKIMLSVVNALSVILFIYFDYKYSLFKDKVVVWAANIAEFIFVFFNICLFIQYDYTNSNGEAIEFFNILEEKCLILIGVCSVTSSLFPFLQFLLQKIILKKSKKSIGKLIKQAVTSKETSN